MKINVIFDKDGEKVGDLDAMNYALNKVEEAKQVEELTINIANCLVIYAFRILVKEGMINPYNELFLYNKTTDPKLISEIRVDKNGEQEDYPKGMMDTYSNLLMRLL